MKAKCRVVLTAACLLVFFANVEAADYKNWLSLLPETLGDLSRSGKPDGINMEMGGQSWSSVQQEYSGSSNREISLTIVAGKTTPQAQAFQAMSNMQMETDEQIVKTVKVSGYQTVLQLDKKDKMGSLMIFLGQHIFVSIDARPITSERELVALAKDVPLRKIATIAK
jgi:hypothetical protein